MNIFIIKILTLLTVAIGSINVSYAQNDILSDRNGDGIVSLLALGDSITVGVGDGILPNEIVEVLPAMTSLGGYPIRVSTWLGIPIINKGVAGEELAVQGVQRFIKEIQSATADGFIFFEGENDAITRLSSNEYEQLVQIILNVARFIGLKGVLATLPPPCCDRKDRSLFTEDYSRRLRLLSEWNKSPLVDLENVWRTLCPVMETCVLFNRPEGLHPNSLGYDTIAQAISATLLNIELFTPDTKTSLASALGLTPEQIIVGSQVATIEGELN
jgi:lysophospholipase L1-like esterase